MKSLPQLSTSI